MGQLQRPHPFYQGLAGSVGQCNELEIYISSKRQRAVTLVLAPTMYLLCLALQRTGICNGSEPDSLPSWTAHLLPASGAGAAPPTARVRGWHAPATAR